MDPHSCDTSKLRKQSFKTAMSSRVACILKDNWAWPYPTFGSDPRLQRKGKEEK